MVSSALKELAASGGDIARLHELAQGDADSVKKLNDELTKLGYRKLGHRLAVKEELLGASAAEVEAAVKVTAAAKVKATAAAEVGAERATTATPLPSQSLPPKQKRDGAPHSAANLIAQLSSMPGAKVMEPAAGGFAKGTAVVIAGLAKKPELNGERAEVIGSLEDGRLPVRISATGASIRIKPENLVAAAFSRRSCSDVTKVAQAEAALSGLNPYHLDSNIDALTDSSQPVRTMLSALENLMGHVMSHLPDHHEKLRSKGLPSALATMIRKPTAAISSDPFTVPKERAALRAVACGVVGTWCLNSVATDENVKAVVAAGMVSVLGTLIMSDEAAGNVAGSSGGDSSGDVRMEVLKALGTLANHEAGKMAIATTDCLGTLVSLCRDNVERVDVQALAMEIAGLLLHRPDTWKALVDSKVIHAATAMLRRPETTETGATKATSVLYILALVGYNASVQNEPGCCDALHVRCHSDA